jgi:anti-sigma-K factor RskA
VAEDRFEEFLGPYLLGELSVEEERELERHLKEGCPKCRGELERIRRAHALLQATADVAPPPELKDRVLAQARGETSPRSGGGWGLWVAAAALLVVAVLGVGLLWAITDDSSEDVRLRSTALAPEAGGVVRVEEVGENFQVELEVWEMPELGEDEYYEMWYYAEEGGGGRISCGTFRVGAEGRTTTVRLTAPANAGEYPEIEITREADDGDPKASGEVVLEGDLPST